MADVITREAKLFEAGDYPDKGIVVTENDLDNIIANFEEAQIKIEHVDSPLDGFLGAVKKVWRRGKELFGSIEFNPAAWLLSQQAGAKKLSVGLNQAKDNILEVSLVEYPRVVDAQVFSKPDVTYFDGDSLGETISEVRTAVYAAFPDIEGCYCYLDSNYIYEDYCILEQGDQYLKIPWTEDVDGNIQLGEAVEVQHIESWIPIAIASSSQFAAQGGKAQKNDGGVPMATEPTPDVQIKPIPQVTYADLETRDKEIEKLRFSLRERDAKETVTGLKAKLTPEAEKFALGILLHGDQSVKFADADTSVSALFIQFMTAMPIIVTDAAIPVETSTEFSSDEKDMLGRLGYTEESAKKTLAGGDK